MYFHYPPTYGEWYSVMTERLSKDPKISKEQKENITRFKRLKLKNKILFYPRYILKIIKKIIN